MVQKTIILLDDDLGVRLAIARALEFAGFRVESFGTAQDLMVKLSEILHRATGRVGFLLDMRMQGQVSGLEVMRQIRARGIQSPIVFLSGESHLHEAIEALKGGAVDFLLKPIDHEKLVQTLQRALGGSEGFRVSSAPEPASFSAPNDGISEEAGGKGRIEGFDDLTRREQEVLAFVLKGFRSVQIASSLDISERTVKMHRSNIMAKVGAQGATHLVYLYQQYRRSQASVV